MDEKKTLEGEQVDAAEKIKEWLEKVKQFKKDKPFTELTDEVIINNLYFLLSGQAGTGKTYTTDIIMKGQRVDIYATPTHQAKNVLQANIKNGFAVTIQSLLGLFPITERGQTYFVAKSIPEVELDYLEARKVPQILHSDFVVIDEASQLSGNELDKPERRKIWNPLNERYEEVDVHVNPPLGTYLTDMIKLKHRLTKSLTSVYFMGDIVQTVPVGTPRYCISKLLEDIQLSGNYAYLEKVRRISEDKRDILDLNHDLRVAFYRIYNNPRRPSVRVNLRKILCDAKYNDVTLIKLESTLAMIETFLEKYHENLRSDKPNPEYSLIINYNNAVHPKTERLTQIIRNQLFGEHGNDWLNPKELILNRAMVKYAYGNDIYETGPDTKMIVQEIDNRRKRVINDKGKQVTTIDIIVAKVLLNHPKHGIIRTTIELMDEDTKQQIGDYWNDNPNIFQKLSKKDVMAVSKSVSDFHYGYVINNYKIQGSGIQYPIVWANNILDSPTDSLHKTTFLYTAISRATEKLYIYLDKYQM